MSIKFICSCGKHLRARDEMAARRSRCPRCGAPVGIPSKRPTHAGTFAAPMTPQERLRLSRLAGRSNESSTAAAITATLPAAATSGTPTDSPPQRVRSVRLPRKLEAHWYQCLAYPFLCRRPLLAFAGALTLLCSVTVLLIPQMPSWSEISWHTLYYISPFLLLALLIVPNVCGTVECALSSALAGQGPGLYWTGRHLGTALLSSLRWLFCFFAGPIFLMALAGYFWLYGGDLTAFDYFILAELGVLTVGYWLLAVVAANQGGRLRDANPVRIAQLVDRLRFRAVVPVLIAPVLLLADGLAGLFALTELHQHPLLGWPLLAFCWLCALFGLTFVFRLLGVWCYRHRRSARPALD